jgi:hypothetical protein
VSHCRRPQGAIGRMKSMSVARVAVLTVAAVRAKQAKDLEFLHADYL